MVGVVHDDELIQDATGNIMFGHSTEQSFFFIAWRILVDVRDFCKFL